MRRLKQQTRLPVVTALPRGGTDYRIDLCLEDGTITSLYKDGTLEASLISWNVQGWTARQRCAPLMKWSMD